jgi:hypothetical protein
VAEKKKATRLGSPESTEMHAFVRDIEERYNWYRGQMQDVYEASNRWWRLYLNKRADPRSRDEDWRANIFVPKPFTNVEAMTAAAVSTLTSADPIWQPEAVHDQDIERAKSVEKLLDYTARKNSYTKFLTKLSREKYVSGTSFFKTTWVEEAHEVNIVPRPGAIDGLLSAIEDAKLAGAVDPPDWQQYQQEFMQWRELVNKSGKAKIPEPPYGGPTRVVRYRGPKFTRLSIYDVILDPLVDEIDDQNFIVHRIVKPRAWVEERASKGFYNKEAVGASLNQWDGRRMSEWEAQLAQDRGILGGGETSSDPQFRDSCELLEVWQPDGEVPFAIVMNRKAVINKNPYSMPFEHGMCAISAVRNIVIPGQFFGQSALQAPESLFDELNKLRNLRSDGATLNVLPIFTKLKEVGLPDALRKIRPGSIIPMSRPDGIQALVKAPMPPEAYREPEEINREIDDAMQVYDSTRGAPATVGRVTGTEFSGRAAQAGLRGKLDIQFQEEDMLPSLHQAISLWAQMSDEPIRVKASGEPSPFKDLSKADLVESLDMQFRFRGVTKALNRDMQIQQLTLFADKFGANLLPQEMRLLMRLILEDADLRGASRVISAEGTMQKTQDYEMQRNAALGQLQAQTDQQQAAASNPPGGQAPPAPPQPPQGGGTSGPPQG